MAPVDKSELTGCPYLLLVIVVAWVGAMVFVGLRSI